MKTGTLVRFAPSTLYLDLLLFILNRSAQQERLSLSQSNHDNIKSTKGTLVLYKRLLFGHPIVTKHESRYNLRSKNCLVFTKPNTDFVKKSVKFVGAPLWNSLDNNARLEETLAGFKSSVQELGF